MSPDPAVPSLTNVQAGDVLVSHSSAVREHEIRTMPDGPHETVATHDAAIAIASAEAAADGVDAWLTEDQTHVVKISTHRPPASR